MDAAHEEDSHLPVRLLHGLALVSAAVLGGCGVRSTSPAAGTFVPKTPGVLTVVTSAFPSFGFFEGTVQHPTGGFEYELARAIADPFGLRAVRIKIEPFAEVVGGNLAGADMSLDLITPTSERKKHLDFSIPYLMAPPTALVRHEVRLCPEAPRRSDERLELKRLLIYLAACIRELPTTPGLR